MKFNNETVFFTNRQTFNWSCKSSRS